MAITNDVPVIGYTDATADYHDTVPGPAKVDGRKLRSAKTKADLLQACRACLQSGDFRPTGAALARVAAGSICWQQRPLAPITVVHGAAGRHPISNAWTPGRFPRG